MSQQPTIGHDVKTYRQGMVLGLTMAEIMLLLVFCLLLALAAALALGEEKLLGAKDDVRDLERTIAQLLEENDRLREALASQNPDEDWRHLVEAAAGHGLTLEDVLELVPLIADLDETLVAQGIDPSALTTEQLAAAIAAGLAKDGGQDGAHDWPPIINLSEAGGFNFDTGSAVLSQQFEALLSDQVIDELAEILQNYDVDIIEVIGHTDEQPISSRYSNLDEMLPQVMAGASDIRALVAGDNAGLGLARAVSVARVLRADERLSGYTILPLSGAQLIENDDRLTDWTSGGDVRERRRIEIRVRGRNEEQKL